MLPSLTSLEGIAGAIEQAKQENKLLFLKFGADWCGPCKRIAPVARGLIQQNQDLYLGYEVDVDVVPGVKELFQIRSLPTFIIIENGNVKRLWIGAEVAVMEDYIVTERILREEEAARQKAQAETTQ